MSKTISISLTFILLFVCTNVFSSALNVSGKDTTFKASLETGKSAETISCSFNDSTLAFTLKIGNASVSGVFTDAFDIELRVLEIDKDDNYKQLVVMGLGPDDDNNCFFYEFAEGKIIACGHIEYTTGLKADGDKILKSDSWMGFWTLTKDYYFDANSRTLVNKPKDYYTLDVNAKVTKQIKLLENRSDNSSVSGTLKPGAKIRLIKADISPTCKDSDGNDESYLCHWYYIKAGDGTEGWCRLRNIQENVEGLPWAG